MKRVTWRFWVTWAALIGAYFVIGFMRRIQASWDNDIYTVGLTAVTVVAILFCVGYTLIGLTQDAHRWWRTDLGTSLMVVTISLLPSFGGLAWVFLFLGGVAKPGFLAWVILSGPLLLAMSLSWRSWVWLRAIIRQRDRLRRSQPGKQAAAETQPE